MTALSESHEYWVESSKVLKATFFEDAFCAYLGVTHEINSFKELGVEGVTGHGGVDTDSCFSGCVLCAQLPEGWCMHGCEPHHLIFCDPHAHAHSDITGGRIPAYKRGVSCDAVTKMNHLKNCGSATSHIEPNISTFWTRTTPDRDKPDEHGPEGEVEWLARNNQLELAYVSGARAQAQAQAQEEEQAHGSDEGCGASIRCARPQAPANSGVCDRPGVVGCVCHHGVPVRGLFMDMRGPEQFVYYLVLLKWLSRWCTARGIAIRDVYIDFACQFRKTFARFCEREGELLLQNPDGTDCHLGSQDVLDTAKNLQLLVNWMHGSSHDLPCQLENNGRYRAGTGHKDGEDCERIWALTKVRASPSCPAAQETFMLINLTSASEQDDPVHAARQSQGMQ